jgi:hypothetical protein
VANIHIEQVIALFDKTTEAKKLQSKSNLFLRNVNRETILKKATCLAADIDTNDGLRQQALLYAYVDKPVRGWPDSIDITVWPDLIDNTTFRWNRYHRVPAVVYEYDSVEDFFIDMRSEKEFIYFKLSENYNMLLLDIIR